jgi:hypothetical protein
MAPDDPHDPDAGDAAVAASPDGDGACAPRPVAPTEPTTHPTESADVVARGWRDVDRQLRLVSARRGALDVDEAHWLVEARRAKVHVQLGFATFAEYVQRILGYGRRAARDRIRVAEQLARLPAIRQALAAGEVSYSAVRELARVATPGSEGAWLRVAVGRSLRDVEAAVRGRRAGDLPGEPVDPTSAVRAVRFELTPDTYALLATARRHLEAEIGGPLSDSELFAVMCREVLRREPLPGGDGPPCQVRVTICSRCDRGTQDAAGSAVDVTAAVLDHARCDAQIVAPGAGPPAPTIPDAIRRLVLVRDLRRCVVPGCRRGTGLEVHRIDQLGGHAPTLGGLVTLCGPHHRAAHVGRLSMAGHAPIGLRFTSVDGRPDRGPRPVPPTGLPRDAPADPGRPWPRGCLVPEPDRGAADAVAPAADAPPARLSPGRRPG